MYGQAAPGSVVHLELGGFGCPEHEALETDGQSSMAGIATLRQMSPLDVLRAVQIGDGPGDPQKAVSGPRAEVEARHRLGHERSERWIPPQLVERPTG